jgi:hypothetical protein
MRVDRDRRPASIPHYIGAMLLTPRSAFASLMRDPRRLGRGSALIVAKSAAYTVVVLLLYLGGVPTMIPAWTAIAAETYYFWQVFFIAAVTLGCWILASGVVQLLAGAVGGSGRFEDVLATTAFAITLPSLATLLPDLLVGLLATLGQLDPHEWARLSVTPGPWRTLIWGYLALYLVGLLVFYPIATAAAHRLRGWSAVGVGLVGAIVYQGTYFIFIR